MATSNGADQSATSAQPHLKRVLSLWDLVYYGIILTSPIAAVPLFGEGQVLSHGHTVATLLLAMVAMSVTAVSFGRMASVYPSSGSVYTYISRELNSHVGFVVGWAMFLEYLFQPVQNALYAVLAIQRMTPRIPFAVLAALTVGLITVMTVQGIRFTARTNEVLLGFMLLVTTVFLVEAFRYVVLHHRFSGLISLQPIYNPVTFNVRALAAGTSLAALVFIGFDGVSILAEEVKNPRRNVLLASVLVVVFTGLFSGLQVYMAQRVWPDYTTLQNPETAFMDVARLASGPFLFGCLRGDATDFQYCLRLGGACRCVATSLQHGTGRCFAEENLRLSQPEKEQSGLQRVDCGGGCLHLRNHDTVGTRGGDRHVWRFARLYGRESGGIEAFLVFGRGRREAKLSSWMRLFLASASPSASFC